MTIMTDFGLYQVKDDEPEHCLRTDYCGFCRPLESDGRYEQAVRNAEQNDFGAEYDPVLAQEHPHP